jgi:hypothetical protein
MDLDPLHGLRMGTLAWSGFDTTDLTQPGPFQTLHSNVRQRESGTHLKPHEPSKACTRLLRIVDAVEGVRDDLH